MCRLRLGTRPGRLPHVTFVGVALVVLGVCAEALTEWVEVAEEGVPRHPA